MRRKNIKIRDASKTSDVIVLPGRNRLYAIGDVAYVVAMPSPDRMPEQATLHPVSWVGDRWASLSWDQPIRIDWDTEVTLIERNRRLFEPVEFGNGINVREYSKSFDEQYPVHRGDLGGFPSYASARRYLRKHYRGRVVRIER